MILTSCISRHWRMFSSVAHVHVENLPVSPHSAQRLPQAQTNPAPGLKSTSKMMQLSEQQLSRAGSVWSDWAIGKYAYKFWLAACLDFEAISWFAFIAEDAHPGVSSEFPLYTSTRKSTCKDLGFNWNFSGVRIRYHRQVMLLPCTPNQELHGDFYLQNKESWKNFSLVVLQRQRGATWAP